MITEIYHNHKGRYGYRRITLELRNQNVLLNHKTVYRLMRQLGLSCKIRTKKYKSYRGQPGKIVPNILERDFYAAEPNVKWSTDVTEFSLLGEKVYLSPLIDLFNGEVVSYDVSMRPVYKQVETMMMRAFEKNRDLEGLIIHSDQGWQYQMKRYQKILTDKGIVQSMSRKGNCLDNSPAECFFGILKSEFFYGNKFDSIEEFINGIHEYIRYYNNDRIKLKLKGMSPVQYRTHSQLIS